MKNKKYIMILFVIFTMLSVILVFLHFQRNNIIISFDTVGGSKIQSISTKRGKSLLLPIPTKEGYIFDGWYANDIKVNENTSYVESTNLIAHWIKDDNAGTNIGGSTKVEEDENINNNTSSNLNKKEDKNVNNNTNNTTNTEKAKSVKYICPPDYTLIGDKCVINEVETVDAEISGYKCDEGVLNGTKCSTSTDSVSDARKTYRCIGGILTSNNKCQIITTKTIPATRNVGCVAGALNSSGTSCVQELCTGEMCITRSYAPVITYSCAEGTPTGTGECRITKTEEIDATIEYVCLTGTLKGDKCYTTYVGSVNADPIYVCKTGTLKGSKCYVTNTQTIAATKVEL